MGFDEISREAFLNRLMRSAGLDNTPAPLVLKSIADVEDKPPRCCGMAAAAIAHELPLRHSNDMLVKLEDIDGLYEMVSVEDRYSADADLAAVDESLAETMRGYDLRLCGGIESGQIVATTVRSHGRRVTGFHLRGRNYLEIWGAIDLEEGVFRLSPMREDVEPCGEAYLLARVDRSIAFNSASIHGFVVLASVLNWLEEMGDDTLEIRILELIEERRSSA